MMKKRDTIFAIEDVTEELQSFVDNAEMMTSTSYKYASQQYHKLTEGYDVELEARIVFDNKSQFYYWNRLLEYMKSKGLEYETKVIRTTNFGSYSIRVRSTKGVDDEAYITDVENKVKGSVSKKDASYWITYHMSLERKIMTATSEPERKKEIKKIVSKLLYAGVSTSIMTRYSFMLSKDIRLDLSHVTRLNKSEYHIEVELVNKESNIRNFIRYSREVARIARGTTYMYSSRELITLSSLINYNLFNNNDPTLRANVRHIDRRIINDVSLLTDKHVGSQSANSLVGRDISYCISNKTDGDRMMLVISNYGIWLTYPPVIYNLICPDSYKFIQAEELTVLDGELLKRADDSKFIYYAFDCLMAKGSDVRSMNLGERMMEGKNTITEFCSRDLFPRRVIDIYFKDYQLLTRFNFFSKVSQIYKDQKEKKVGYDTDGFIFTPANTGYSSKSILKWKSREDTTIDFRVKKLEVEDTITATLYVESEDRLSEQLFEGSQYRPFEQSKMIDQDSLRDVKHDSIVEMGYNADTGKFFFIRDRGEKYAPNGIYVARTNWENIISPLTINELTGKGLYLAYRYHSAIKTRMLEGLSGVLLDLGSGKGGVLRAQSNFNTIICVEKNKDNIKELIRRAELLDRTVVYENNIPIETIRGMKNVLVLVECDIFESDRIIGVVSKCTSGEMATVVTLMDVGTFLWKSYESMQSMLDTVGKCLRRGGNFLWKMMDGRQVIKEAKLSPDQHTLTIGKFNITYEVPAEELTTHSRVVVTLPGSILEVHDEYGGQEEYLTDPSMMYKYLQSTYEIHKVENGERIADEEELLGDDAARFSRLYCYGMLTKERNLVGSTMSSLAPLQQLTQSITKPARRQQPAVRTQRQPGTLGVPRVTGK